ncbi:hypothetical protein BDV96DRAFT_673799 [Lophiotrema nucula]|uniref:BTB domain-containing protein n=1 Tax=Lophiotrema nucula TaxID=690887 RepID=A0A6A5YLK0_9PLEO|nr:hypothetical protein BDV96DRAFT_673799 [Lophiotrema nucula]
MDHSGAASEARRKRRYEDYVESQKSLLETGKFSDFVITCNGRTWHVHKAIIAQQCAFFDGATRFGKSAEDNAIDLPEDDPDAVGYMLQYLYELDYDVPPWRGADNSEHIHLDIAWGGNDNLTRREHRVFAEHLVSVNEIALKEAAQVVLNYLPYTHADARKLVELSSHDIDRTLKHLLLEMFERPSSKEGSPHYRDTEKYNLMIHAKVYVLADKYVIKGLRELALENWREELPSFAFDLKETYESIDYLCKNTLASDKVLRKDLAATVCVCLDMFGMRGKVDRLLEENPDLATWVIKLTYRDREHTLSDFRAERQQRAITR